MVAVKAVGLRCLPEIAVGQKALIAIVRAKAIELVLMPLASLRKVRLVAKGTVLRDLVLRATHLPRVLRILQDGLRRRARLDLRRHRDDPDVRAARAVRPVGAL